MIKKMEEIINISEYYSAIFDLIKLLFIILYIAHICTCAWHFYSNYLYEYWQCPDTIIVL